MSWKHFTNTSEVICFYHHVTAPGINFTSLLAAKQTQSTYNTRFTGYSRRVDFFLFLSFVKLSKLRSTGGPFRAKFKFGETIELKNNFFDLMFATETHAKRNLFKKKICSKLHKFELLYPKRTI